MEGSACHIFFLEIKRGAFEVGKANLDLGQRYSNMRSMVLGHSNMALGYLVDGNFPSAIKCMQAGVEIAADPFYSQYPRLGLGISYLQIGQYLKAENVLKELSSYCQKYDAGSFGLYAYALLGIVSIVKGQMNHGLKMLEDSIDIALKNKRQCVYAILEHTIGRLYLQFVQRAEPISLSTMAKNICFLLRNVPTASKKAEIHFNNAIEVASKIGAKSVLAQAYLDLGILNKAKGRIEQARYCISSAIQIFEESQAEIFLKQAYEALESLR